MGSAFETSLQRYIETLGDDERQEYRHWSISDITSEIQALRDSRIFRGRTRRFIHALEPLVHFLSRYAKAVDILVQYNANPSALIWGSLRVVIVVSSRLISKSSAHLVLRGIWAILGISIIFSVHEVAHRYVRTNR